MNLSWLQRFCGCDVKESFFVNGLGSQIGLTDLGCKKLAAFPTGTKPDHMVGIVSAILNTFGDAQKRGFHLSDFHVQVLTGRKESVDIAT
jgi:arginyl-tRNA synthetase